MGYLVYLKHSLKILYKFEHLSGNVEENESGYFLYLNTV